MPATFPCTITVVDGDRPIADAIVVLSHDDGLRGLSVNGKTNARGVARVKTVRLGARYAERGAPAGRYHVSIEKRPPWDEAKTAAELDALDEGDRKAYWAAYENAMTTLPREVPRSLSEDRKQPLEVTAGAGGHLVVDVAAFNDS